TAVTFRDPGVAPDATVTFTVRFVAVFHVVVLTVIPVPENDTVTPNWKLVPTTVRFWFVAPCPRELGVTDVIVGPAFTVNPAVSVADVVSGFVTVTLRAPVAAVPLIVMFAVRCCASTKVVEFTVIPAPE